MRALVLAFVLLPCAVLAAPVETYPTSLIDRPLVLPQGKAEFGLLGNVSNWSVGGDSLTGEAGALGAEIGFGKAQLGVVVALPLNPGFGFGSAAASAAFALAPQTALRLDFCFDRIGLNGDNASAADSQNVLTAGLGVPFRVRLAKNLSFVSGNVGAMSFAHFTNVGINGTGAYLGGGALTFSGSDLLSFSATTGGGGQGQVTLNLPLGLLIQVAPPFSITLHAGYVGTLSISGGTLQSYLPVGIDAVFTTAAGADIGASFSLAGPVDNFASIAGNGLGYADIRNASLWLRFRT
jgi:hypothetical protein